MWLVYALLAAVCFGARGILYHWTAQRPIDRNFMLFGVFLSGALISLTGTWVMQETWTWSVLTGILMGTFSFAANASMYKGFAVGKASIVAIFTGLPSVVVAVLAYLLWGETLSVWQLAAFAVIIAGVLFIQYSDDVKMNNLHGVKWGILAMLFFGLNDTTGKQAMMLEAAVLPTLVCMFFTGSLLFLGRWLLEQYKASKQHAAASAVRQLATSAESTGIVTSTARTARAGRTISTENDLDREVPAQQSRANAWPLWRVFIWGLLVGITNVSGMIFILPAFKLGITGLVSAVVALNVLIILMYTRLTSKRKFTRLETIGITCAFTGIVLLRLFE